MFEQIQLETGLIYEMQGLGGVIEYANTHGLAFLYCAMCETNAPSAEGACLCCGGY